MKDNWNGINLHENTYLVEKIAGQRWENFVQERIFSPLDMAASNFVPEPPSEGQINAKGYRVDRDEAGAARGLVLIPFRRHTELAPGAAGALFSTLADLIQWLRLHVNEGHAAGNEPDNRP